MLDKSFRDYQDDKYNWITLGPAGYYPDFIPLAIERYGPALERFRTLMGTAASSTDLYRRIVAVPGPMKTQLCRIFRKYISPAAPVEVLKKVKDTEANITGFAHQFRPIADARAAFGTRPVLDEVLCSLLWEYKARGEAGYELTGNLFPLLKTNLENMTINGPVGAGPDIQLKRVWPDYPNEKRPVDFMIRKDQQVMAVGLARYDSDRGGGQEDDRTGHYQSTAKEIVDFADSRKMNTLKVIFINDGPGLLAGSMWDDYSDIDTMFGNRVRVATLKMVPERITRQWLES